ncbi:MAG: beta-lactamase family protein [Rhizobiales bacterium]|nr:beta-lactamase family protein [Hyphomicrobiales bacterium]
MNVWRLEMAFRLMRVLALIALIPLLNLPSAAAEPDFAEALRPKIEAKLKDGVTPGAMVLVDIPGRGTWIEPFGTAEYGKTVKPDASGHTHIGSVTKTLTAQAVLLLADDGKLRLDDPIEMHMPGLVPNGGGITLRQMLNMTSGIFNGTEDIGAERNPGRAAEENLGHGQSAQAENAQRTADMVTACQIWPRHHLSGGAVAGS